VRRPLPDAKQSDPSFAEQANSIEPCEIDAALDFDQVAPAFDETRISELADHDVEADPAMMQLVLVGQLKSVAETITGVVILLHAPIDPPVKVARANVSLPCHPPKCARQKALATQVMPKRLFLPTRLVRDDPFVQVAPSSLVVTTAPSPLAASHVVPCASQLMN